ncbi:MAG TPA: hypothetical protein VMV78_01435 [Thiobacillus sp.]|nr:hypothetical protein [Thiobacillus sp.]
MHFNRCAPIQARRQCIYLFPLQTLLAGKHQYGTRVLLQARLKQGVNVIQPVLSACRIGIQRRHKIRQTCSGLLCLNRDHSKIVVCLRVAGLIFQDGLIKLSSFLKPPRLMVRNGLLQQLICRL